MSARALGDALLVEARLGELLAHLVRVWRGEQLHSANIAGGLHHAMPDRAAGFCVYNDAAIGIQWLLDHGADAQLANRRGHTPLAGAAFKGDLPMVRLLVERGTDVESPCADGKTALMMAAMFNHTAIVEWLVAQGADPHATDAGGTTPLAAARMMGASEAVALLQRIAAAQA